jgi:hypothetical protein
MNENMPTRKKIEDDDPLKEEKLAHARAMINHKRQKIREVREFVYTLTDEEMNHEDFKNLVDFIDILREKKRLENRRYNNGHANEYKNRSIVFKSKRKLSSLPTVVEFPALSFEAERRLRCMFPLGAIFSEGVSRSSSRCPSPSPSPSPSPTNLYSFTEEMEKYKFDIFTLIN